MQNIKSWTKSLLAGAAALSLLSACGSQISSENSELSVTNGREIGEDEFASTVLLVSQTRYGSSICTATFVNDRQAITASHCVVELSPASPEMYYVRSDIVGGSPRFTALAKAISYKAQARYSFNINNGVNKYDLAIVNFPAGTAPAAARIASQTPSVGSELVIVGYGNNENFIAANGSQGGTGSGVKRVGTNEIALVEDGMLVFAGNPSSDDGAPQGEYVSSGSGDSGGPMFVNGELVGVTSGGGLAQLEDGSLISISRYVDLNSPESKAFLAANLIR